MNKLVIWYCLRLLLITTALTGVLSLNAIGQTPTSLSTVISDIKPHTICAGYTGNIELTWTASDNGLQTQQYTIAVFADNATSTSSTPVRSIVNQGQYTSTTGSLKALKATTTLLNSLPAGKYKLAILHASIATMASFSNEFLVASPATAIISDGSNTTINAGDVATVRLTLGGTGPWSYSYDDLKTGTRQYITSSSSVLLSLYPTSDYLFSPSKLLGFSGYCGTGSIAGFSQVRVAQLGLSLNSVAQSNPCPGSTITAYFTVSGIVSANTRYKLQLSDSNGSFDNARDLASGNNSPLTAQTPANDGPGSGYRLRVVSEGTVLTSNAYAITFSRPAPPAVTDYSFCLGTTPSAPTAIGTNLQWFSNDGYTTSYGSTAPNPPGNQSSSYRVSQTINNCPSSTTVINVIARPKSTLPSVSSPVTYCQNQTATSLNAQGSSLLWTTASGVSLGSTSPIVSTSAVGTQQYYVTQNDNGCRSDPATITVTVTTPPSAPTLLTSSTVCQYAEASGAILSSAVVGQNLRWYVNDQGGVASAQAPTPRTSTEGIEQYYVSQVINGCESSRARLEQTIIKAPDRPQLSANSVIFCVNDSPRSLTANGTNLRWYEQQTGGTYSLNAPTPPTGQIGTRAYYVSQVAVATTCESQRLRIDVQVLTQPNAPQVTAVQFLCQNVPAVALSATGSGLQWNGPGIIGESSIAPIPSTDTPATLTYQVSQRIGTCASPLSTIQVTVRPQPTSPVVIPLKLCQGSAARTLQATGENLRWYTTFSATDAAKNDVTFTPSAPGTYSYYVRQVINGCESPLSRLEINVSAPVRAVLSGDSVVVLHDSTAIRIRFVGDAPYTLTLWNSRTLTTSENPLIVWVKPTPSNNTFKLQSLANNCGAGNPGNSYWLYVLSPLGTEEPMINSATQLTAFPNPNSGQLSVNWVAPAEQTVMLSVSNINGTVVWERQREGTGKQLSEILSTNDWSTGTYILNLSTGSTKRLSYRLIILR